MRPDAAPPTPSPRTAKPALLARTNVDGTPRRCLSDRAAGGIFVLSDRAPALDTEVDLEIGVDQRVRISTIERVVRDDTGGNLLGGRPGFAIELRDLSAPLRRRLLRLADVVEASAGRGRGLVRAPAVPPRAR